jgi:nuclear cap-binding protein subunit 1
VGAVGVIIIEREDTEASSIVFNVMQTARLTRHAADEDDYDRRPQRRRYEEPLVVKVRKQLLGIAETPLRRVEDEISSIAKAVCDNYDDDELRTSFYDLALQLILEQPFKTPFVAAVVLFMNTLRQDMVEEILKRATALTNESIVKGEWREVKLYMKFLGSLQGLLSGEGVFPALEDILAKAVDLQTENNEEVSSPRYTRLVSTANLMSIRPSDRSLSRLSSSLFPISWLRRLWTLIKRLPVW